MPSKLSKKTYRSTKRTKRNYKKKKWAKRGTKIGTQLGFPAKILFKHKYVEGFTISSTAGSLGTYVFRANDMYDPNYTSTGHQPMYFDQVASLYNYFTVIGSRMRVQIVDNGTDTTETQPFFIGAFTSDDVTLPSSYISLMEANKGVSKLVPYNFTQGSYTLTQKYSPRAGLGEGSKGILHNHALRGSSSASPNEQVYYVIWLQPNAAENQNIKCKIEIDYIAVWNDRKQLDYS